MDGWQEFNRDVLLSFDGPFVQESGLITPHANGVHGSGKKRNRAGHGRDVHHLAELSDGGTDLYGFFHSVPMLRPWIPRLNVGDKLTSLQSSRLMSHCRSGLRENKNRKLRGNRERRGDCDQFFRKKQPGRFPAFGWGSDKDRRTR
jgi:hypothetical protein